MTILKVKHLKRYKDLVWLLLKYGQLDLLKEMESDLPISDQTSLGTKKEIAHPEELVKDLQFLGPTFVKLGQLLSTQSDLLPENYAEVLSTLQDQAEPFPYHEVEIIIQEELGAKINELFDQFDQIPIAAASLSQVHRAILPSKRIVAVKVQRPNIRQGMIEDLNVLDEIAHYLEKQTSWAKRYTIVEKIYQLRMTLLDELDFKKEALNLASFKHNLREFSNIIIPDPITDYTNSRVLTMDFIEGQNITKVSPLVRMDIDGNKLAQELFEAYLKQILLDGLVHVDPHPGNVYLSQDNRIIIFDLGMIAYIGPQMQTELLKLLLAISEGEGEEVADIIVRMGVKTQEFDFQQFKDQITRMVVQYQDLNWSQLPMGRLLLKFENIAAKTGAILPSTFNMLGKALLNLDHAGKIIAPHFNPNEAIRKKTSKLLEERIQRNFSWGIFYKTLLEGTQLIQHFPAKLNDFLEVISKNNLKLKIDIHDQHFLIRGFEKIANRITLGLILAALIIGASQLMKVQTDFTIWGYPGFAMLLFLSAAIGGLVLMMNILRSDKKEKNHKI